MEIVKSVFQSKGKRYQFIRYCTVGTLAAGIHYGVYYLLQEYEMTNLNIAYTIGYVTSFICNFFLTSYFTFRSNPSLKRALLGTVWVTVSVSTVRWFMATTFLPETPVTL